MKFDPDYQPKLRWPIDVKVFESHDQRKGILLRCPLGVVEQPLALVFSIAPVISSFDGQHSCEELIEKFSAQGLTPHLLAEVVELLDKNGFLEGESFEAFKKKARENFSLRESRAAAYAGTIYSTDPIILRNELEGKVGRLTKSSKEVHSSKMLVGLAAPHIDYQRGLNIYADAYRHAQISESELVILLGTAHQYSPRLFHLCSKAFESPLGLVPTETRFIESLAHGMGRYDPFFDQFLHKNEHSLELQIPFLQVFNSNFRLVPILVGSFHHMLRDDKSPEDYDEYCAMFESLVTTCRRAMRSGDRICFIASVDIAHVGRSFGDPFILDEARMKKVAEQDHIYLGAAERLDRKSLWASIAMDLDARRVCGYPSLYLVIHVLKELFKEKVRGRVVSYHQAVDASKECGVTMAALQFEVEVPQTD